METLFAQVLEWIRSMSQSAGSGIDVLTSIDPGLRTLAAGVAAALEMFVVSGLFVPGDTIVLLAAAAVGSGGEGVLLALAIAVGSLVGEIAGFLLGGWVASRARGARIRRGVGSRRFGGAQRFLLHRGGPAILAARFIPGLRTVMPFVVGSSGFSFRRFLVWSIPASIAWSAIYVSVYSLAAAPLRDGSGSVLLSVGLVVLGIVVFGSSSVLQYGLERSQRRHADADATPTDNVVDMLRPDHAETAGE